MPLRSGGDGAAAAGRCDECECDLSGHIRVMRTSEKQGVQHEITRRSAKGEKRVATARSGGRGRADFLKVGPKEDPAAAGAS